MTPVTETGRAAAHGGVESLAVIAWSLSAGHHVSPGQGEVRTRHQYQPTKRPWAARPLVVSLVLLLAQHEVRSLRLLPVCCCSLRRCSLTTDYQAGPLPVGVWLWRVRVQHADGSWSDWSQVWSFTITTAPAGVIPWSGGGASR